MKKRKTIGLALGSGGWRGLAHLGVIKEFKKQNIPIDFIAGSSVGSLVGGLYSYFQDTQKIEEIINSLNYYSLYKILAEPGKATGLLKGKKLVNFLETYVGEVKIEDLKTNFVAVCTDLFKAKEVLLNKGKLSTAIRASSSIPLVFNPVKDKDRFLIDGGVITPVPTKVVRQMGADIVIAVNLYNNIFPFDLNELKKPKVTSFLVSRLSYQMVLYHLSLQNCLQADLVINPKIWEGDFSLFRKFVNNKATTLNGEKAARKIIPNLKKML